MSLSIRQTIMIFLGVIFIAYILFQARLIIIGPRIEILSHADMERVGTAVLSLHGKATNIAWLTLNDHQIFTDEEGYWSEKLIISEGQSIMTLKARDRFGREAIERVRLLHY